MPKPGTVKHILKELLPPAFLRIASSGAQAVSRRSGFFGNYSSWQQAVSNSNGYDSERIFRRAKSAALQVKNGEAAFERDTVVFPDPDFEWPLLSALLWGASRAGDRLRVLDFGGSLGSLYFQHRRFFQHLKECRWTVVEQPHIASWGNAALGDGHLRFCERLEDAQDDIPFDLLLMASVLPYVESPYELLRRLLALEIPVAVIDKMPILAAGKKDRLTVQRVDPAIYPASYPAWFFDGLKLEAEIKKTHRVVARYNCRDRCNIRCDFVGFILEKS
jgi:putative methyltransferase (TIGR04325 family)